MKITSAPEQTQHTQHMIRRRMAATLIACLGILALAVTPVVAAPAITTTDAAPATVEPAHEQGEEITFDDLETMIADLHATGEVTFAGTRRLLIFVDYGEFYADLGYPNRAIAMLEHFKDVAANPRYVLTESARQQLLEAADQLIAQLRAT